MVFCEASAPPDALNLALLTIRKKHKLFTESKRRIEPLSFDLKTQPILRLQRHVIRGSNGNFVDFSRIIMKIVKNYVTKHNLHISGKR